MKALQYVYGRVQKGYAGYSGYQLAGISPELFAEKPLLDTLQKLSFYNEPQEGTPLPRFSFFSPDPRHVALGRSALARDLSGSVGSFCHILLFSWNQIIQQRVSPVSLLTSFQFYTKESELPVDRSLPALDLDVPALPEVQAQELPRLFTLADTTVGLSPQKFPLFIMPEGEILKLWLQLLSILPISWHNRFPFSTFFVDANEFLTSFRMVSVPSTAHLPSFQGPYHILDMSQDMATRSRCQNPDLAFLQKHIEHKDRLLELLDKLAYPDPDPTIPELLHDLLSAIHDLALFLDACYGQKIFGFCLGDENLFAKYYGQTQKKFADFASMFSKNPLILSKNLLSFFSKRKDQVELEKLYLFLAHEQIQKGQTEIFNHLCQEKKWNDFLSVICHQINLSDLMSIANILDQQSLYHGEVHQWIVQTSWEYLPSDSPKAADLFQWLDGPSSWLGNTSKALAWLYQVLHPKSKKRQDRPLPIDQGLSKASVAPSPNVSPLASLTQQEYQHLLQHARPSLWLNARPLTWWIQVLHVPQYEDALIALCLDICQHQNAYGQAQSSNAWDVLQTLEQNCILDESHRVQFLQLLQHSKIPFQKLKAYQNALASQRPGQAIQLLSQLIDQNPPLVLKCTQILKDLLSFPKKEDR